jgi:hypothetical protein
MKWCGAATPLQRLSSTGEEVEHIAESDVAGGIGVGMEGDGGEHVGAEAAKDGDIVEDNWC